MIKPDRFEFLQVLRALSVFLVVFSHLNVTLFTNGFFGVDLFFVISGFVITHVSYFKILNGRFSYFEFIVARCKRIIPAFLIVILISVIFFKISLSNAQFEKILSSSFYSILFLSNFELMFYDNYFNKDQFFPLRHLWSLAVEFQFYILYPFFLVWFIKFGLMTRFLFVLALSLFTVYLIHFLNKASIDVTGLGHGFEMSSLTYYFSFFRFFEFLLGAIFYFLYIRLGGFISSPKSIFWALFLLIAFFGFLLLLDLGEKGPNIHYLIGLFIFGLFFLTLNYFEAIKF